MIEGSTVHEVNGRRPSRGRALVEEEEMGARWMVVDLEATCDARRFPRDQMETIEIGAVLVDPDTLDLVGEWQTFVKPVVRPWLTAFCTELTSITQEDVDGAPVFAMAVRAWEGWLDEVGEVRFASWGAYDKNQLLQDARRHGVALPFGVDDHLNVKAAFAERTGTKRCGMSTALRRAGLPLEGTHHRGIDDARNIARLLPWALGRQELP